jgi:branched-chain amino acid transport system substrate-binding protein
MRNNSTASSRHRRQNVTLALAAASVVVITAACSSSGSSSSSAGTAASGTGSTTGNAASAPGITTNSINLGFMTTLSGPIAVGLGPALTAFEARIKLQNAQGGVYGRQINISSFDDQASPTQALSAVQSAVQVKNVFAMGLSSPVAFAAEPYMKARSVPAVGWQIDGPEWNSSNPNMFPIFGSASALAPAPAWYGKFFKQQGVTTLGIVAYNLPSATDAAKNTAASAEAAGIKVAYLNTTIPATQSGGFDAVAQALANAHVNGIVYVMQEVPNLALAASVKQAGLTPKMQLFDGELNANTLKNPQAAAEAQGVWAYMQVKPAALHSAAGNQMEAALKKYEGQTEPYSEDQAPGWVIASAMIQGLQAAGRNPTRASFMAAMKGITDFTADGLSVAPTDFATAAGAGATGAGPPPGDCVYTEQLHGTTYVANPTPICGGLVPNSNANS